jgi:hypothetical protein
LMFEAAKNSSLDPKYHAGKLIKLGGGTGVTF